MNLESTSSLYMNIFITFLGIKFFLQTFLLFKQKNTVLEKSHQVPAPFKEKISLTEHKKAADYTIAKCHFAFFSLIYNLVLLLLWTYGGGLSLVDTFARSMSDQEVYQGLIFFGVFGIIGLVLSLPEDLYNTFVIEEKFGFNKTTVPLFFKDLAKQTLLSFVLGALLLGLLLKIMISLGDNWWFVGWVFMTAFQLLLVIIYPTYIAPLFNKFTPLDNADMIVKIEALLKRTGFNHSGLFVMDASKRSSHGNAYFTGMGKTKRIVFFDNLLNGLTPTEVEAVLAHELGHFKHKHIIKTMVITFAMMLAGFFMLGVLYKDNLFYESFNNLSSSYMALTLFMMVIPIFSFYLTPVMSLFSRKNEYEADSFAAKYSSASELISALVKLYKENASTLTPDPLYSVFYHSHPPALLRINHLNKLSKNNK